MLFYAAAFITYRVRNAVEKQAVDYKISKTTGTQSEAVFKLVCSAFASGSELHKALNISTHEYRDFLRPSFDSILGEDLSLIALDQQNKQILGCLIACDFCGHVSSGTQIPERFKPISALRKATGITISTTPSVSAGQMLAGRSGRGQPGSTRTWYLQKNTRGCA